MGVGGGAETPWSNKPFQVDILIVLLPGSGLLGHMTDWLAG